MSINNREDANKYYQMINGLVDNYIDQWKIKPSNLKKYLKPGSERFNKFMERNKLKDIKGADRILKDVIDDRYHMEKDGVITFEAFKFFESEEFKIQSLKQCLYKGIEKATNTQEKILADCFDTNLGDINIVDSNKHLFRVKHWEIVEDDVVIYSKEDLGIIVENMIDYLYNELSKNKIKLTNLIEIELSDLIKKESFDSKIKSILTKELVIKIISSCLIEDTKIKRSSWDFKEEFKDHFIWIR